MAIVDSTLGSPTKIGWKRRSRAASFSTCWRYSSSVVAPIARRSPRASIGFIRVPASTPPPASLVLTRAPPPPRPPGPPRADDRVQLVDEEDDLARGLLDLVEHGLQP